MRPSIVGVTIVAVLSVSLLFGYERKPKIAVMEIEDTSKRFDATLIENATEILRSKLTATDLFVVIDKSRQHEKLKALIKEQKKESYKECYDERCQIPLGQALAADTILRSSISCITDTCVLSVELVDLAKEATIRGGSAEFAYRPNEPETLMPAIGEVVRQLTETPQKADLPRTLPPSEEPVMERRHPYLGWGIGVLVLGAGALGAAIGCDVTAARAYDDYRSLTSDSGIADFIADGGTRESFVKRVNNLMDEGDAARAAAIALYAGGAALVATGITLMVWWKETPVRAVGLTPLPGGMLLSFGGRF